MVPGILPKLNGPSAAKLKGLLKHELFGKIRKAFTYQVLGAAAAFVSNVILARYLGASTFGIFNFSVNLLRLLIIPALLGFGTYTIRYYARMLVKENWSNLRGYKRFINVAAVAMSALIILIGYFIIYHTNAVLPANRNPYMVFVFSLPFFAFINLHIATSQAMHRISLALVPNNILLPLLLTALSACAYYTFSIKMSSVYFAWIYFVSTLIIMIYMMIGLRRFERPEIRSAKPAFAIKEWLTTSLPMLFTSSLQFILKQADIFMIGILLTSYDVGVYSAALKIDNIILFGLTAVNFVEAPIFSRLYAKGDMKALQKTVKSSAWLIFVFTVLISLPVLFFGKDILALFGKEFTVAYWPLIIILISNAINALSGSVGLLMSMTNHQNEAFYITAVSTVICLVLNYFLINAYGIVGASIAIAIAVLIRNVTMIIVVKKLLGLNATVLPF